MGLLEQTFTADQVSRCAAEQPPVLCNGKREARAASRRRQLELGTTKDELFELLRRILADFGGKNAYSWVSNHNQHI